MLRSMFTAIGSLNLHQSYLDVVANNLANANTTGYKASRVIFQDQFAQLLNPGSSPTATAGGTNPVQIGLGVQMGGISPVFSQGMMQSTGRNLDVAVQGDGFFIYSDSGQMRYSREGSLARDASGYLVNSSTGYRVQGWMATNGSIDTNMPTSDIQIPPNNTVARATENAIFGGNLLSSHPQDDGDPLTTDDNPINVTMGIYDSLGQLTTATVSFTHDDTNPLQWNWDVTSPAAATGSGTVVFDANGRYVSSTGTTAVTVPGSTGAATIDLDLDMTNLTMLATPSSASVTTQDGLPAGNVTDIFVAPNDGSIWLVYSNGMREQMGQLALARFSNPTGLIRTGHTTFQQGFNSGEPQVGAANTGGRGTISAGYLEGSNVDMAQEFTNMILAQRGFQASSRVITTSDEIIQELVNLKR